MWQNHSISYMFADYPRVKGITVESIANVGAHTRSIGAGIPDGTT